MTRVRRGETITFSSALTEDARRALPFFWITPYAAGFWLFHGPENILLRTSVAMHGKWKVWPMRWKAKEVARYWSNKKELWLPFLDYCESSRVMATLHVGNGLGLVWVSFEYHFHAKRGTVLPAFEWDSVPPASEVLERFDELCALLERDAIGSGSGEN